MNKYLLNNHPYYERIIRWWLIFLVFFIPFQRKTVGSLTVLACGLFSDTGWSNMTGKVALLSRIDEVTLAVLLPVSLMIFWKNRSRIGGIFWILVIPFIAVVLAGSISGITNENSLRITSLGIFEYVKNFLFIFVFAAFFREADQVKKIFRVLLYLAMFLCVVAVIQEAWALASKYIIMQKKITLFDPLMFQKDKWRMGMYRATSLVGHYNILGFFSLLVLTLYFFTVKKIRLPVFIILSAGIAVSVSRMSYLGFAILILIQVFRGRKWLLAFILPLGISLIYMSTLEDFNISKIANVPGIFKKKQKANIFTVPYREYARGKAMEIWKDHPVWGVGPGMFGGIVSVISHSPYYEEYNFDQEMELVDFLNSWKSLDQFWPQILAEMGIAGTLAFVVLLASWMIFFLILIRRKVPDDMRGFFTGLAIFMIMVIIFSFGNPLKSPVIVVYSALCGMATGAAFLWRGASKKLF
ncbi:MAG: O-antigen ligase family protein [Deferribacteres bacterium]|nr:O-antigen ligase family protein [Deferribacteres bacterium]